MRFAVFLSLFYLLLSSISAQNLHAILVADTKHPQTGKGHSENLGRMQTEVGTIARLTGLTLKSTIIKGEDLNAENIRMTLENLVCQPQDVVIFYFSGTEYLPTRYRGASKEAFLDLKNGFLSPSGVNELIEVQKPKLTLVITDLCNQTDEEMGFSPQLDKGQIANYEKLFLRSSGNLFLNNHVAREQSELALSSDGSVFTGSIIQAIRENGNWDDAINRSRALTIGNSGGRQNPQATAEITTTISSEITQIEKPTENLPEEVSEKHPKKIFLRQEVSSINLAGENIDTNLETFLAQQGSQVVADFQQNLSRLAEIGTLGNYAESSKLTQETLSLFTDARRIIETSGLSQRVSKKLILPYLRAFYKPNSSRKTEIQWYSPAKMSTVQKMTDGTYQAEVTVYQEYLKKDANGNLVYGDRVPKSITLIFTPDTNAPSGYQIRFGNIRVAGKTVKVP